MMIKLITEEEKQISILDNRIDFLKSSIDLDSKFVTVLFSITLAILAIMFASFQFSLSKSQNFIIFENTFFVISGSIVIYLAYLRYAKDLKVMRNKLFVCYNLKHKILRDEKLPNDEFEEQIKKVF